MRPRFPSRITEAIAVALVVFAGLFALRSSLPWEVFWISDTGNRFIQLQSILYHGFHAVSIAYPAASIDPDFQFFPLAAGHFALIDDTIFSIVPFVFPYLCAFLFQLAGHPGLFLLPIVATAACAGSLSCLIRGWNFGSGIQGAVLLTVFSPFLFYSLVFWEHTVAAFVATVAVFVLLGSRRWEAALAAGLLLGTSCWLREEGWIVLTSLLLTLMLLRAGLRTISAFLAGFALAVSPLLVLQSRLYGSPLGVHLAAEHGFDRGNALAATLKNFYFFLLQFGPGQASELLVVSSIGLVLIVGTTTRPSLRTRSIILFCAAAALLYATFCLFRTDDPILSLMNCQGLLPGVTLLLIPIAVAKQLWSRNERLRPLMMTITAYALSLPLVLRVNWTGIIWGPRYFLVLVPLSIPLVVVAAKSSSDRWWKSAVAAILIASLILQLAGVVLLNWKLESGRILLEALRRADAPIIVTDVFWLPEEMASLFYEKPILSASGSVGFPALFDRLERSGHDRIVFASSPDFGGYTQSRDERMRSIACRTETVRPERVPFMTLVLYHFDRECRPATPEQKVPEAGPLP